MMARRFCPGRHGQTLQRHSPRAVLTAGGIAAEGLGVHGWGRSLLLMCADPMRGRSCCCALIGADIASGDSYTISVCW